jgi:hypothetical protein
VRGVTLTKASRTVGRLHAEAELTHG